MTDRIDYVCEACGFSIKNVMPPVRHKCRSRGLGDTIAKITKATGIATAVKVVTTIVGGKKANCGCSGRQDALNKLVPYAGEDNENGQ